MRRTSVGTLNYEIEGLRLAMSWRFWVLQSSPDAFPAYLNCIAQGMMEYIADVAGERVRFRSSLSGYAHTQPVASPCGSGVG